MQIKLLQKKYRGKAKTNVYENKKLLSQIN